MNAQLITENTENEAKPQPKLELLTGGLDGGGPWLSTQPVGAIVLIKPKAQGMQTVYGLIQVQIADKSKRGVLLFNQLTQEPFWVDPAGFCRAYDLWEILADKAIEPKKNKKKDIVNVEDYRAD